MPLSIFEIFLALPTFALVLFRIGGMVLTAPIYGSKVIPVRVRAAMTFTIAAIVTPLVRHQVPADVTLALAIIGGVGELMIGVTIGLALSVLMMGAEVAGLVVGRQAGVALANVFDPSVNRQVSIIGQIYSIVLTLVFLIAGGHRAAMAALLDTFSVIPLMSFQFDDSLALLLVEMLGSAFVFGIRLAGPVLIALFLLGTTLAFLSRTMPQLNILSIGFTLRALVALGVAGIALGEGQDLMLSAVWNTIDAIRSHLGLAPDPGWLIS